jgi:hypothetical protein
VAAEARFSEKMQATNGHGEVRAGTPRLAVRRAVRAPLASPAAAIRVGQYRRLESLPMTVDFGRGPFVLPVKAGLPGSNFTQRGKHVIEDR